MCRMLGMVAARPMSARDLLHDAPRSLRALSLEHADGWGLAMRRGDDWSIQRSTTCAARCASYANLEVEGTLAIAHIRKKTVGELALANTHPFRRGGFVFAHNGTLDAAPLASRTDPARLATLEGTTDSEKLFMFVLTHVDRAGEVGAGVAAAARELHALGGVGSASFLISCGTRLYAHRMGRTLFTSQRDGLGLIASEPLTDGDRWEELEEQQVVVLEAGAGAARVARAA